MKFIQINLNHCEIAQDILEETTRERQTDIVIISEPYRGCQEAHQWVADASGKVAIWVCGRKPIMERSAPDSNLIAWVRVEGIYVFSVYAPPSLSLTEFASVLQHLESEVTNRRPALIAGDFNAWSTEWGSKTTTARGDMLLDSMATLDMSLVNTGNTPTFCRGDASSVVDLTFASSNLIPRIKEWRVSDIYTHSDHQALVYEMREEYGAPNMAIQQPSRKWSVKSLDHGTFAVVMEEKQLLDGTAEDKANCLMKFICEACNTSMTRTKRGETRRPPAYWWTEGITQLRKQCIKARRRAQRTHGNRERLRELYKAARAELRKAIKTSKRQGWIELCGEVDDDPWGRPYKIVMTKLKGTTPNTPTNPGLLTHIVTTLFPRNTDKKNRPRGPSFSGIPSVTTDELRAALSSVRDAAAPGPDGIPNKAIKLAVQTRPDIFLEVYNACLQEGIFPVCWKKQRLVLIPKLDKPLNMPASYRPLCMLDTAGKILEKIICRRLENFTESKNGLSELQFGFRKARSTIDAINTVVQTAREAISGKRWNRGSKKYCAIITLDVKNAFNSAQWPKIVDSLHNLEIPDYIINIICDYFRERQLQYHTDEGPKLYNISTGVPQGSVLGPILWNIMFDGALRVPVPSNVQIVGYADDMAIVVTAKTLDDVTLDANDTIDSVRKWLIAAGLQLADHKTELVLVSSRKKSESITVKSGSHNVVAAQSLRYLGVQIDCKLRFDEHLGKVGDKAAQTVAAISRIMPNVGGPRQERRKLLASVVTSTILYAAPVWHEALNIRAYARQVNAARRRSCLRVICGFRTISHEAAGVLAGIPPLKLEAEERARVYAAGRKDPKTRNIDKIKEHLKTLEKWQSYWIAAEKGRWTACLIPDVRPWVTRRHGELDYYLTQLLSGHGCFRAYLHRFGHDDTSLCPSCPQKTEDAEHVIFECLRFTQERNALRDALDGPLEPGLIVGHMLKSAKNWRAAGDFATTVMKKLREEDTSRRLVRDTSCP